jgi:hypothetical protein
MSTEDLPIPKYNNTEYNFDITAVTTGFTEGINLGNFETLDVPKVAMLVGKELIHAGEIWHMFDQKQLCH